MSKGKLEKNTTGRSRSNVADSIDATAKRIAESLNKHQAPEEWEQDRIEHLKSCDGKVGEIPIHIIRTNQNVRKRIDEEDPAFKSLVESIRTHGVLQPPIITVVTNENGVSSILLVGGERRLRAAKMAGFTALNCLVRIFDNQSTRLTASMSENMNRRDLECLDIGHCFLSLSEQGYLYSDIERLFNRDERTIGRYIKMARWPHSIQETIRNNEDKFTARYLLTLASRKMSESELEQEINSRISGAQGLPSNTKKDKKSSLLTKFSHYCHSKNLGKHEQDLIYNALLELGVISNDTDNKTIGRRKGASGEQRSEVSHDL